MYFRPKTVKGGPGEPESLPQTLCFIRFSQRLRHERAGTPKGLIWTSYYKRFFNRFVLVLKPYFLLAKKGIIYHCVL